MRICPKCKSWRVQTLEQVISSYRCLNCGWIEINSIKHGFPSFPSWQRLRLLRRSSWVYVIFFLVLLGVGCLIFATVITPAKYFALGDKLPLFSEKSGTAESVSIHQPEKIEVVANSKSMRYHLPGTTYYDKIPSDRRVIFPSEEAAQQAGYTKSSK